MIYTRVGVWERLPNIYLHRLLRKSGDYSGRRSCLAPNYQGPEWEVLFKSASFVAFFPAKEIVVLSNLLQWDGSEVGKMKHWL